MNSLEAGDRFAPVQWRPAAALAAGLLMGAAFPPVGWWWAAPLSVCVSALVTQRARPRWAALYGAIAGLGFFGGLLWWMTVVGLDAWLGLTAVCTAWWVGLFALSALIQRRRLWPLVVPALWVASETLRGSVPLGGFPWGRLVYAQVDGPLLALTSVVGPAGVSYLAALLGSGAAYLVLEARRTTASSTALVSAGLVGILATAGFATAVPTIPGGEQPGVTVAVVQGGVPGEGLSAMGERQAVLRNHAQLTRDVRWMAARANLDVDFVVWPENATDIDPFRDAQARSQIDEAVRAAGVPVLVGAVVDAPGDPSRVANSGIVWDPQTGPGDRYVKRHPVPFGEYVPMRSVLGPLVDRFRLVPRDFIAGTDVGVLSIAGVLVGDVICFEVAYDALVRDTIDGGAQMIVVQTNNATYGGTAQLDQQIAMSRVRAVEHGRPVVVAATSGISAVVDADGSIRSAAGDGGSAVLIESITPSSERTIATEWGVRVEFAIVAMAALAAVTAFADRRRGRHDGPKGAPVSPLLR